jgi:hypothetical protein
MMLETKPKVYLISAGGMKIKLDRDEPLPYASQFSGCCTVMHIIV